MRDVVSIIVPTYNVEQYLRQCLDSICNQTYQWIEVIVVIDGATDSSQDIALVYAEKDKRIQVVLQENMGSGPARNNGIYNSHGKYIVFVDPDDWIEQNMISDFVDIMDNYNPDLILSKPINVHVDKNGDDAECDPEKCNEMYLDDINMIHEKYLSFVKSGLIGSPTKKMYKREIINKYNIQFPDLRRSQDIVFNYLYYEFITSVFVSPNNYYYYRLNKTANIRKTPKDYYKTALLIDSGIQEMFRRWNYFPSDLNKQDLANITFGRIAANVESNVLKKMEIDEIIYDNNALDVTKKSRPNRLDKKILRRLILSKDTRLIILFVYLKNFLRRLTNGE